jgi:pimeloyl-ACP methyl ester carboxylesterase
LGVAPLLRELLRGSVADPQRMTEPMVARYMAPYVGRDGVDHLLRLARLIDKRDMDEIDLRALPHPTLIIRGEKDQWVPSKIAEELSDTIGGSRLVRLPDVGRLVPEEAADTMSNLLLDFIGARGTGGTF